MTPEYGERLEYIIRKPDSNVEKQPLYKLATPLSLFLNNFSQKQINNGYYMDKLLIPSMKRLFELMDVDVSSLCLERNMLISSQVSTESDIKVFIFFQTYTN